jgi:glycosyltransferase involved in cell wall biosynthesis
MPLSARLGRIKGYLQEYRAYILLRAVNDALEGCRGDYFDEQRIISLVPESPIQGNVLFSYGPARQHVIRGSDAMRAWADALLAKDSQHIPNVHTNYWASIAMARTFLGLGYCVDVISHRNTRFLPTKPYDIVVDLRRNLERLAPMLPSACIRVMHLDTAHILFWNAAESRRLLDLQRRRRITLRPRRSEVPNLGIEHADCATTTGNEFTIDTYRYAGKPIYRLPVPASVSCPWPGEKAWEDTRRSFLWFGSGGLVHKGLDVVLEAFAETPELRLTVCGPIEEEQDFARAYYKELYCTPNIRTVGWVDVNSPAFLDITRGCSWVILLSCAEGANASVVNCMHAGLIPILTYECGVDVDGFGVLVRNCSIRAVKDILRGVAELPINEIKERALRTWECARSTHTREQFTEQYRRVAQSIIRTYGHNGAETDSLALASAGPLAPNAR